MRPRTIRLPTDDRSARKKIKAVLGGWVDVPNKEATVAGLERLRQFIKTRPGRKQSK